MPKDNPRTATLHAPHVVRATIEESIWESMKLSQKEDVVVEFYHNGVKVRVEDDSNPWALLGAYYEALKKVPVVEPYPPEEEE